VQDPTGVGPASARTAVTGCGRCRRSVHWLSYASGRPSTFPRRGPTPMRSWSWTLLSAASRY